MINKIALEVSVTDKHGKDMDIVDALDATGLSLNDLIFKFMDASGVGTSLAVDKYGDEVFADGKEHDDKTAYVFYFDEVGA